MFGIEGGADTCAMHMVTVLAASLCKTASLDCCMCRYIISMYMPKVACWLRAILVISHVLDINKMSISAGRNSVTCFLAG